MYAAPSLYSSEYAVPMPSIQAYLEAYGRAQALYASCGITTAQEGMMPIDLAPLYKALIASRILKLDISPSISIARI